MTKQGSLCLFASDLHGNIEKYKALFQTIKEQLPRAVFLGGDLLPSPLLTSSGKPSDNEGFITGFIKKNLIKLKEELKDRYPPIFSILGNDDGRMDESDMILLETEGLWFYSHEKFFNLDGFTISGYSFIPPTPFIMKDWERYDVSRYVDPGCTHPAEGLRSVELPEYQINFGTISEDLNRLFNQKNASTLIILFHSPPYQTNLDRAALDGKMVDHAPLDVHIGSIAIRRFIEQRQPYLTLHGHVHESSTITGSWQDKIKNTRMFSAAYEEPGLALILFDLNHPEEAQRLII